MPSDKVFRRCGMCHTWNTRPCGEQCVWSPDDPAFVKGDGAPSPVEELEAVIDRFIAEMETVLPDVVLRHAHMAVRREMERAKGRGDDGSRAIDRAALEAATSGHGG